MPAQEYELQALQLERRRNEELERKLAEEVHRREELIEEEIRLRDRRKLQVCGLAMFMDVAKQTRVPYDSCFIFKM